MALALLELFKGFVDHSVVGMVAFDSSCTSVFANSRAMEILEFKDTKGVSCETLFPDPSRTGAYTLLSRDLIARDGMTSEVMMKKVNGHYFLASLGVKHVTLDGHTYVLLTFQDVTIEKKLSRDLQAKQEEIERAYGELLEQNRQLKELDHAKDKFIALTTHELRTPLSAIMATAEVLELKLYESEEQKEEFIKTISEQGRHLMDLVNDVLDFAKIRAGKMDFYVESVELKPLVTKLFGNFTHMAEQANVTMKVDVESGPTHAWVDLLRLKEVVNNCVSNAIKYNRNGGTVTLSLTTHERFARLMVKDTGVGIPADKISSVFNEFETVGHVSKHHKGTGLGMPISKRLMESMGGGLSLKSESGVGSEFYIDIPLDKVLEDSMYRSRPDMEADLAA